MKPSDLERIEIVGSEELASDRQSAFVRLWAYRLRNIDKHGGASVEYNHDVVVTRFRDAVVVVPYCRDGHGRIMVGLHYGTRPAPYLRYRHTQTPEPQCQPVFCDLVAGGVEESDYSTEDGFRNRAAKELLEEAGISIPAEHFVELGSSAFTAPGFAIEKLHFFGVEVDPSAGSAPTSEDVQEDVSEMEFCELSEALTRCRTGEIADQKTEVALFRFASHAGTIPKYGLNSPMRHPMRHLAISDEKKSEIMSTSRDRAWFSFDERRRHEYHISLTFWAIYILTIGYVLREGLTLGTRWSLAIGVWVFALLYFYWNYNLAKTQRFDLRVALFFYQRLLVASGVHEEFQNCFEPKSESQSFYVKWFKTRSSRFVGWPTEFPKNEFRLVDYWKNWNHRSELAVTVLLALVSFCAIVFARAI